MLSIIICTYNRADLLELCLESIFKFAPNDRKSELEILVVNNNCTDNTSELVKSFQDKDIVTKEVLERTVGLSAARNRAITEAQNDWLAYFDDDVVFMKETIGQIFETIEKFDFDCFGGGYQALHHFEKPDWFEDSFFNRISPHNQIGPINFDTDYIAGCNMVFKKASLLKTDLFPLDKGMTAKKIQYGEETRLVHQMRDQKMKIGFNPKLMVEHIVRKRQYTLRWNLHSAYAKGRDSDILSQRSFLSLSSSALKSFLIDFKNQTQKSFRTKSLKPKRFILASSFRALTYLGQIFGRVIS